jgi:hypothetical protein
MAQQPYFAFFGLFPSCLKKGFPPQQGRDTDWPIAVPLDQFMKWMWRVDTWEVTSESSTYGTETAVSPPPYSENLSNVWNTYPANQFPNVPFRTGINPEAFDCSFTTFILEEIAINYRAIRTVGDIPPQIINGRHYTNVIIYLPDSYIDGNTVYPRFSSTGTWGATRKISDPRVNAGVKIYMKMDGIDVPMFPTWFPSWLDYPSWTASAATTYVIQPRTYFSYDGTYDTQTGEVIKPF